MGNLCGTQQNPAFMKNTEGYGHHQAQFLSSLQENQSRQANTSVAQVA